MSRAIEAIRVPGGPLPVATRPGPGTAHVFHHPGAVALGQSDEFPVLVNGTVFRAHMHATVTGTGTAVNVLLNGFVIATLGLGTGVKDDVIEDLAYAVSITNFDWLALDVTATGGVVGLWAAVFVR